MSNQVVCPYCKEAIESTAVKCKHCLEFLPDFKKKDSEPRSIISEHLYGLIGKALIPLTILILAWAYQPVLATLLTRTKEAEFLGTKLSFTETRAYTGSLTPLELYYLIGSADNFAKDDSLKSRLNYDSLKEEKHDEVIASLEKKGLIESKVEKYTGENKEYWGEESLIITPTEKGTLFLIELGVTFNAQAPPNNRSQPTPR